MADTEWNSLMHDDGWHTCHFCGQDVKNGLEPSGERHWLSDCRPDLVRHEIGPLCTWPLTGDPKLDDELGRPNCYAYQDLDSEWTAEHSHFYEDGPM